METTVTVGGYTLPKTDRAGRGRSHIAFPAAYCVVDIETTGLSPQWDSIIEISAIRCSDGETLETFQTLVQPGFVYEDGSYIDEFIEALTGITNEMLADAPPADTAIKAFDEFIGDRVVVGYNFGFDANFLYDCYMEHLDKPFSNDYIDLMRISRKLYPDMDHHRLRDMAKKFHLPYKEMHRALNDVMITEACYERIHEDVIQQYGDESAFISLFERKSHFRRGGGPFPKRASDIVGDESKFNPDSPLYKKYVVFTGKLEKFTRNEAMQIVADLGGLNESGVTKKTNYLVLGNNDYCTTIKDGKSTKQKKAEKSKLDGQDIEIIPETVFYDMIGEEV